MNENWRQIDVDWNETNSGEHDYNNVEPQKFATPAINGGEFVLYGDAAEKDEWIMGDTVEVRE